MSVDYGCRAQANRRPPWPLARRAVRIVWAVAVLLQCPAWAESVHTKDDREIAGRLIALDAKRAVLRVGDGERSIPLEEIARVRLGEPAGEDLMSRKGRHVLCTDDGSGLAVRELTVGDGRVRAVTEAAGQVALPLERVARILRPLADETADQLEQEARKLGLAAGKEDVLAIRSAKSGWASMSGILGSLRQGQAAFTYEGHETAFGDESVALILPAQGARADAPPVVQGRLTCADGSRMVFTSLRLDANNLLLESPSLGSLKLRREAVAEVLFEAGQRTFLSELAPAAADQTSFFDDEFSWRKDRSVSGQPLTLDAARYEKGLGLHARCRLVYELGGAYRRFSAVAGIDGELRSGKAGLSIHADGKVLVDRLLLDRLHTPRKLDLDLKGVRLLTVLVDFAEGTFGDGARVNLCDAALIK